VGRRRVRATIVALWSRQTPVLEVGSSMSWQPVWELLRRSLYRGQILWNKTKKRDKWP
jgi:hypothetical protein